MLCSIVIFFKSKTSFLFGHTNKFLSAAIPPGWIELQPTHPWKYTCVCEIQAPNKWWLLWLCCWSPVNICEEFSSSQHREVTCLMNPVYFLPCSLGSCLTAVTSRAQTLVRARRWDPKNVETAIHVTFKPNPLCDFDKTSSFEGVPCLHMPLTYR